jgi:large subunit ribosomal protein L4
MPSVKVKNIEGNEVGTLDLDDAIFGAEVHEHLLWETVKWQQARKRQGSHATKSRAAVSGSGKKPWRQKGTGRARQGSHRAPHWVGGGRAFAKEPRDYSYKMPKKARKKALCSALSLRLNEDKLVVLDQFPVAGGKTRSVVQALAKLGADRAKPSVLIVDLNDNGELIRGSRNLTSSKWIAPEGLNVYDVLNHDHLIMTRASAKVVEQVLRG